MKFEKVSTIKSRIWAMCRTIIRHTYGTKNCYICGKEITELKKLHTSHLFKKESLPLPLKFDLRLLRPSCYTCNRQKHGNEGWFVLKLIENEGLEYVLQIVKDIKNTPDIKSVPIQREFLLDLEQKYVKLIESYQRMS